MATLFEMATLITTELGVYDDTSFNLAKAFLSKNYVTLWDKYPWVETEIEMFIAIPAGQSAVEYPVQIDRAITVRARNVTTGGAFDPTTPDVPMDPLPDNPDTFRSDARFLDPVTLSFLIQTEPSIFEAGGYVKYYGDIFNPNSGGRLLRVYPTPIVQTELLIVGKAKCPGLTADDDHSRIRNLDPAIMAYAYFDMLQRQRQYGKADLKRKEAQELEAVAWSVEQQQANQPRFTKATTVAGNTLVELTDAVCVMCGQWTPEYRLIIREFLRRNYQTLYDTFLWPESLVVVRVPYTTEQVVLPNYIDRVLGIRGTNNLRMFPADAGLLLDITPSVFDEIGAPISYTTLTPVAVPTLPGSLTKLSVASTSPVDTGWIVIRGEQVANGTELEENFQLQGTTPVISAFAYDIPITVAKDITAGFVTINAVSDGRNLGIIPSYLRELKHQRVWFLPAPEFSGGEPLTCLVMGKRAIRPLLADQDTPIITGAQQVLIASAAADLFRKLEKHDLANAQLQKADGSMAVLKNKNMDQAASAPRFVPQIEPRAYVASGGCAW